MYDLNLQLFSEELKQETTAILEEQKEENKNDLNEEKNAEEIEKQDSPAEPQQNTTQEEKVPLNTFLSEKKKRKELERRLRELEENKLEADLLQTKKDIRQKYIEKGYDEELADMLADDIVSLKAETQKAVLNIRGRDYIDEDIEDLSKSDPYYNDAIAFNKEIKDKISEFKAKNIELSVEDAYNIIRPPKIKLKEMQEDMGQKALLERRDNVSGKFVPNATSSTPKDPYPLDDVDMRALEGLQKMDPGANWTQEKFWKIKNL